MIRWFTENGIAANFLMLAILIAGAYSLFFRIPLEVSPERDYQSVMVRMKYRGATAKDIERAILIPVEEALEAIQGIQSVYAGGERGSAWFWLEAEPGTDLRAVDGRRHGANQYDRYLSRGN